MLQLKKNLEDERLDERKEQLRLRAEEVRQAKERRRNPVREEEPGKRRFTHKIVVVLVEC
jgi:hypothetical protein